MLLERSSGAENAESEEGVAALADFESRFSTHHNVRRSGPGGLEIFANVVCRSGILGVDRLLVVSQTLNHGLE